METTSTANDPHTTDASRPDLRPAVRRAQRRLRDADAVMVEAMRRRGILGQPKGGIWGAQPSRHREQPTG